MADKRVLIPILVEPLAHSLLESEHVAAFFGESARCCKCLGRCVNITNRRVLRDWLRSPCPGAALPPAQTLTTGRFLSLRVPLLVPLSVIVDVGGRVLSPTHKLMLLRGLFLLRSVRLRRRAQGLEVGSALYRRQSAQQESCVPHRARLVASGHAWMAGRNAGP